MFDFVCGSGSWGLFGDAGLWGLVVLAFNLLFWLGLFAALAVLLVRSARARASTAPQSAAQPGAKEILQTRYAQGEISRDEYEKVRRDLLV